MRRKRSQNKPVHFFSPSLKTNLHDSQYFFPVQLFQIDELSYCLSASLSERGLSKYVTHA